MGFLKIVSKIFLLPGSLVIGKLGITQEQSGFFSSIINVMFWGAISYSILLVTIVFPNL